MMYGFGRHELGLSGDLGLIRLAGLENGLLAEFAVEGVEAHTPSSEPATIGRLAIKNIDITGGSSPTADGLEVIVWVLVK